MPTRSRPRVSACLAALGLTAILAACAPAGGTVRSPLPSPSANARLPSEPPAGYVAFASPHGHYVTCPPVSWTVHPGASLGSFTGDSYVGIGRSVVPDAATITWESAPGYDSARYATDAIQNLRNKGVGVQLLGTLAVDGTIAQVISFAKLAEGGQRYTVREALWSKNDIGWVAAFASDPNAEATVQLVFEQMLACFRTVGRPAP